MNDKPLLEVKDLVKHYPLKAGLFSTAKEKVHAVNGVSFQIPRGKTLGLVGESGCGKTTTGKMLLRLIEADSGDFRFDGSPNVFTLPKEELKAVRSRMQYIFQDPYASLDPKMQIRSIVTEPLKYSGNLRRSDTDKKAAELLDRVGLQGRDIHKYPHEFSGGQRQRISIARALSNHPSFIVCDEPVSSLDVSIQSQILNLLLDIQKDYGITYLFIAHNLAVVFLLERLRGGHVRGQDRRVRLVTGTLHKGPAPLYPAPPGNPARGNRLGASRRFRRRSEPYPAPSGLHLLSALSAPGK